MLPDAVGELEPEVDVVDHLPRWPPGRGARESRPRARRPGRERSQESCPTSSLPRPGPLPPPGDPASRPAQTLPHPGRSHRAFPISGSPGDAAPRSTRDRMPRVTTITRGTACNLCEAIRGLRVELTDGVVTGVRGDPVDRSPAGTCAPRAWRSPTSSSIPSGSDARYGGAGRSRTPGGGDRLGRGPRPHRRPVGRDRQRARRRRAGPLPGQPERAQPRLHDPRHRARQGDPHPQPVQRHLGGPAAPPAAGPPDVRPPAAAPGAGPRPHRPLPGLRLQPDGLQRLPTTLPDFPARLRELTARGGRMVVVDPRRTETAKVADEHLFIRPGADVHVLLAMVHVLLTEDLARPPAYVDGLDRVRAALADHLP